MPGDGANDILDGAIREHERIVTPVEVGRVNVAQRESIPRPSPREGGQFGGSSHVPASTRPGPKHRACACHAACVGNHAKHRSLEV